MALIPIGLLWGGCAAKQTAECAEARSEFEQAMPSATGFHLASGDVIPALVAGVALAVVERMPETGPRERCYDEIMRGQFANYPPYATVQ